MIILNTLTGKKKKFGNMDALIGEYFLMSTDEKLVSIVAFMEGDKKRILDYPSMMIYMLENL